MNEQGATSATSSHRNNAAATQGSVCGRRLSPSNEKLRWFSEDFRFFKKMSHNFTSIIKKLNEKRGFDEPSSVKTKHSCKNVSLTGLSRALNERFLSLELLRLTLKTVRTSSTCQSSLYAQE
jgi:hypothetical protein